MSNGLNADKWEVNKGAYSIVPESYDDELTETIKAVNKHDEETTGGWNKSRTMKRIGTVPYSVYYNFALANGVQSTQIHQWYTEDKGKNMKRLLNELPVFRLGDKI